MNRTEFADWLSSYTDANKCLEAFDRQKRFFRVNTIKADHKNFNFAGKPSGTTATGAAANQKPGVGPNTEPTIGCIQTPYCKEAFELTDTTMAGQIHRTIELGKTWEYFLGLIYPQALPSILVSRVVAPTAHDRVLDVAAAPGSKFSHMAALMGNRGVLVGNDVSDQKISALYATINRLNVLNCVITKKDGVQIGWKRRFSKVLLDAPCTALGSGASAMERWTIESSEKLARIQKKMLFSAYDALMPGGELVYSTCTYTKEENEAVVANLLDNVPSAQLLDVGSGNVFDEEVPHDPGLSEFGDEFRKCYRIYPHHLQSEGFFIAKIRKGVDGKTERTKEAKESETGQ